MSGPNSNPGGLARALTVVDYFTLGFGACVGVGWVSLMGDWLNLGGGPIPAALGFLLAMALMIPIGFCYAELTPAFPVAGGELAFAYRAYGTLASFLVGWFMALAYISVCPWEAIAIGHVLAHLFPGLQVMPMYSVKGYTLYLPVIVLGVVLSLIIIWVNYVGVKKAAKFQTYLTYVLMVAGILVIVGGFAFGSPSNLLPVFAKKEVGRWGMTGSILSVFAMAPFFLAGFDTIPQGAEEADSKINYTNLGKSILYAILAAGAFYILVIIAAGCSYPWQDLAKMDFATSKVFEVALGHPVFAWIALVGAIAGLVTTFNGLFLATTRVLFALGRARLIPSVFGAVHPKYQTPHVATMFTGVVTLAGAFLGRKWLVPLADVGSLGFCLTYLGVALSAVRLRYIAPDVHRPYVMPWGKFMGVLASIGGCLLVAFIVVPGLPSSLAWPTEYALFMLWTVLGFVFYALSGSERASISEETRRKLVLGE